MYRLWLAWGLGKALGGTAAHHQPSGWRDLLEGKEGKLGRRPEDGQAEQRVGRG